jgi:hypothetical protein
MARTYRDIVTDSMCAYRMVMRRLLCPSAFAIRDVFERIQRLAG